MPRCNASPGINSWSVNIHCRPEDRLMLLHRYFATDSDADDVAFGIGQTFIHLWDMPLEELFRLADHIRAHACEKQAREEARRHDAAVLRGDDSVAADLAREAQAEGGEG